MLSVIRILQNTLNREAIALAIVSSQYSLCRRVESAAFLQILFRCETGHLYFGGIGQSCSMRAETLQVRDRYKSFLMLLLRVVELV